MPIGFVEEKSIVSLVNQGHIVIASGGGGIPVIKENGVYSGVSAVIDKDFAARKLAANCGCDQFMILTDVENASINYKKPDMESLRNVNIEDIKTFVEEGQFAKGSMEPKVKACIGFVEDTRKPAYITSLDKAIEAVKGNCGTVISNTFERNSRTKIVQSNGKSGNVSVL